MSALERSDYETVADACAAQKGDAVQEVLSSALGLPGPREYRMRAIAVLAECHRRTPLLRLYADRSFPESDGEYALGGHDEELGHLHIAFARGTEGWRLKDITITGTDAQLQKAREQIDAWLASRQDDALLADPRVQRIQRAFRGPDVNRAELLSALDAVLAEVTRSAEESTPSPEALSLYWWPLAWMVCTVVRGTGILTPHDLWLRRLTVVAALADDHVQYYDNLMATKGSAWANGLRRAKQFRALVKASDCSLQALSALIQVLEREYRSEGSAFWLMLEQAQWAAEPLQDTAT